MVDEEEEQHINKPLLQDVNVIDEKLLKPQEEDEEEDNQLNDKVVMSASVNSQTDDTELKKKHGSVEEMKQGVVVTGNVENDAGLYPSGCDGTATVGGDSTAQAITEVATEIDGGDTELKKKDGSVEETKEGVVVTGNVENGETAIAVMMSAQVKSETDGSVEETKQGVVVTENDEAVNNGGDSKAEAITEVAKDATVDAEVETETDAVNELKKDSLMEVTRNEGNGDEMTVGDFQSAIKVAQDRAMDVKKQEEVEQGNEEMGVQRETTNTDTEKLEVQESDEMVEEKVLEEMDATKQEKLEPASKLDDSQEGALLEEEEDEVMGVEEGTATEMETETDMVESGEVLGGKRKTRSSKSTGNSIAVTRASSRKTIEEDVCFICYDGGELVLCDRRGCPKAYHPPCVNRDEAFFQSKGRWNCGWHLCNICEKNAYYMCYTCTFSLCKRCIKDAVILCIRGNKGFCETCMRTIKQIEGNGHEDKDVPVDYDNKSSRELLFKDYFVDLKERLSISSEEIASAKSLWRGSDKSSKKHELAEPQYDNNDGGASSSDHSIETLEASKTKRKSLKRRSKSLRKEEDSPSAPVVGGSEGFSTAGTTEWASKELLEFVKHMKKGDASVISQFDVQALLLEYIKTKKLRDPRRKSQIICDSRLERLFGKPRVGHFEMLKLLESHFVMKEDSQTDDVQGSVVDTEVNHFEADANEDPSGLKDKKRKRKKGVSRGPQSNLDDYAAINVHNINLIYLRRKLIEDLLEENDNFPDKIVGMFVRIRISGSVQKQDVYRLVQVVGTSKAAESYKLGKRTTDIALEILNLNKTEAILIDTVSNQDFTEEECKRLRQSIRCGLINRLTVGDILDKTMEIHAARVDDWLESEILRLSHLRDRASEKGRKKELRECVEKLQLLKTPDERNRRLEEIPEIHADPNMDPSYESEDDDRESESKRDVYTRSRESSFNRRGPGPVSPRSSFSPKDSWGSAGKIQSRNWELDRSLSIKNILSKAEDAVHAGETVNENAWNQGKDREAEYTNRENLVSSINSETVGWNAHAVSKLSGIGSIPSPATLPDMAAGAAGKVNETEKMWHYKDPSGKMQGPFSVVQLRKWSNTGYFPADLKIWKTTANEDKSILLTDALAGRFEKDSQLVDNVLSRTIVQNQDGERPHVNHARGSENSSSLSVPSRWEISSSEVSPRSTERWSNSGSLNLPSPTPKQDKPGSDGRNGAFAVANSGGGFHPPSVQNSAGHLMRGSEYNASSDSDFGPSPKSGVGIAASSTNAMQYSQSIANNEHTAVLHSQPGSQYGAVQSIQSLNIQHPNVGAHNFDAANSLTGETNISVPATGYPQGYGNWVASSGQNSAASFSNTSASVAQQPGYWTTETQAGQPNVQPPSASTVTWGVGQPENISSASALRPENLNTGWGIVPGNPNMTWTGQVPAAMNMNWGTVQAMPVGNANPGFVVPTAPVTGNFNQGWVAPISNPAVHGLAYGNANQGWVAPAVNMGSTVQGPAPLGNGWDTGTGNPGTHVQGPPPGDTNGNQGWHQYGSQDTRNNDHCDGGNFSGRMDKGSHGGSSGHNDGSWNRQSSFGRRPEGSSRGYSKKNTPCPYNTDGRCVKGSRCDYLHS